MERAMWGRRLIVGAACVALTFLLWKVLPNGGEETVVRAKTPARMSSELSAITASASLISQEPELASAAKELLLAGEPQAVALPDVPEEEPVIEPEPMKLQAIIYNPARPSAIINGTTMFIGDSYKGQCLVSLTPTSAQLVGSGRTNLLAVAH